jgi:hypothetical protein
MPPANRARSRGTQMLGAGTVINPIIKTVTTVAILAAVYFFILKPVFDTTNEAFDSFSDSFPAVEDISSSAQDQINDALDSTSDSNRLRNCLKRAIDNGANQQAIDRCIDRFGS